MKPDEPSSIYGSDWGRGGQGSAELRNGSRGKKTKKPRQFRIAGFLLTTSLVRQRAGILPRSRGQCDEYHQIYLITETLAGIYSVAGRFCGFRYADGGCCLSFDLDGKNAIALTNGIDHIHIRGLAKDGVDAVQMALGRMANKELATAGVFAGVGHG